MERAPAGGRGLTGELVREGDYWTVSFDQRQVRLRDSKGMGYLAELLSRPGVEISALELAGGVGAERATAGQAAQEGLAPSGEGDLGPLLDPVAKEAYRRRLEELRRELDEAQAFHDPERSARARDEYEIVARELASATGLRGRDRRSGSQAERARLNVTRAIRSAVDRIEEHDPALGEYLQDTVLTGRECVYSPAPERAVDWRVFRRAPRARTRARFEPPDVSYVRVGDVSLAYQVFGDGPVDVVFSPGWISHLDFQWTDPTFTLLLRNLSVFARVITFDRRGVGLSDPVSHIPTLDERIDDVRAILDAAHSERAVLFGLFEGAAIFSAFAATYPERVQALVLYGAFPASSSIGDFPGAPELAEFAATLRTVVESEWGSGATLGLLAPELAGNRLMRRLWGVFERASMSPAVAAAAIDWLDRLDIRPLLSAVQAPTLVLHCTGDVVPIASGRYVAAQIPGARFVELPGSWHAPLTGDMDMLTDEVEQFVKSVQFEVEPDRVLATVLALEAAHPQTQALAGEGIAAAGGVAIDARPRSVVARFAGPARAVECARSIAAAAGAQGLLVGAAVHTGECSLEPAGGLGGAPITIATALAQRAAPGEVLVTGTVRDVLIDSGAEFAERDVCEIAGVSAELQAFAAIEVPGGVSIRDATGPRTPAFDRAARTLARHAPGAARATLRVVKGGR